jgi:small basic protein (TIGR04137 family)
LFSGAFPVSLDKTLKVRRGGSSSRNVLSRGERIARLQEEDRFAPGRSPFGLPKVRVMKALAGKKKKKTAEEGAAAAAAGKGAGKAAKGKK